MQCTAEQESDGEAPATGEAKGEGRIFQPRLTTGHLSVSVVQGASDAQLRKMQQVCSKRTHSIEANTFYSKRTHSILNERTF
jgi:hypothetical protein